MSQQSISSFASFIMQWRKPFTPFMKWIGELKNPDTIKADVLAGITVVLVLVPQSMAYAQLAGLPAYVGLYASFLPAIIAALFGSSKQLATGPVAIVSLMTATALEPLALNPETYLIYAAFLALMVGLFQLSLGLLKLGVLVDFLSHPVVMGFTNAAALIIASSQISKLFGLEVDKGDQQYEYMWNLIQAIPDTHLSTLFMGLFSITLLVGIKRFFPKAPNILITVVLTILISKFVGYHDNLGGSIVGHIPKGLPDVSVPSVSFDHLRALLVTAALIALIGFVEAISVAKAIASQTRQRISANQELVGQGLSNIASSLTSGYAVSGSFSRSAVNFSSDARTGLASIVTGALVAITLLYLTPLLYHLPQATLAAVIIVAVAGLVKLEPIIHAFRVQYHDGFVAVFVFFATLIVAPHLETSIMLGVLLSLGLYLYRTMKPKLIEVARHEDKTLRNAKTFHLKTSDSLLVLRYDGDLYFANAGYLEGKMLNLIAQKPQLKAILLDISSADQVDATGEEMLHNLFDRLEAVGIVLHFIRAKKHVREALARSGLVRYIGKGHFFRTHTAALLKLKEQFGDKIDIEPYLTPIHDR